MTRRTVAVLLLAFLPAVAHARRRAVQPPTEFSGIDAIARQALADGVPGISIAVVHGDRRFAKAYGYDDVGAMRLVGTDTIFEIGSVTKQFTAAAIMRLVERGKLRVADKAAAVVPELASRFPTVTIDQLLTHTSGIPEYNDVLTSAYAPKSESEMLALITGRPLLFTPGSNWSYSNSNYYILGIIVERLTGDTYAHVLQQEFFLPLGLTATDYCRPPLPAGYIRQNGENARVESADMSLLFGAGAICSTAADLTRWNEALVSGRAVSSDSYAKMTTPVRLTGGIVVPYGYALLIDTLDHHPRIWHNGLVLGYNANLAWYPDGNLTIAVLVNVIDLPSLRDRAGEVSDAIARMLLK